VRFNILGGPGAGKSKLAAYLFSQLHGYSVELVQEHVKTWVYLKRNVNKFDQCYLFGKQQQDEYQFLVNGVKNIITDCPCILTVVYAQSKEISKALLDLCLHYDFDYPCYNIILLRGELPYQTEGRYQGLENAKQIDKEIENVIKENYTPDEYGFFDTTDWEGILAKVREVIDK
jgi:nicotinamide riboside kinase